jgi:short-subunit dehydrogenase
MFDYKGVTALITGASSGMGAEYARELASQGSNLILVARRLDRLQELATELTSKFGISVDCLDRDLSATGAGRALADELTSQGKTIDVLVNNAGFGTSGSVAEQKPESVAQELNVNVVTVTELTSGLLPGMLDRNHGVIINMASLAAFQARANHALYSATKAYVLSFTEALWGETISTNVRVTTVCPGPIDTEFFSVAGTTPPGKTLPVSVPIKAAFAAIDSRKPFVIVAKPGMRLASKVIRMLPARVALKLGK